jgi:hypothetical protein
MSDRLHFWMEFHRLAFARDVFRTVNSKAFLAWSDEVRVTRDRLVPNVPVVNGARLTFVWAELARDLGDL